MAVVFDGTDDYNTYVQDDIALFPFTIPVTIFFRYKYIAAETGFQPILTIAEPTNIASSGSSFQVAKNDSNQIVAKCQRVGDPSGFTGLNTNTHSTVLGSNSWHDVICHFDSVGINVWVNSTTVQSVAWNKNNAVVNLSRLGCGGVYLFGAAATNVKPSTSNAGLHYGAGRLSDVGIMNDAPTTDMITDYITNNFSCPKIYESWGGNWKYMALDTLPPGQVSPSFLPSGCYGSTITYSNFAADVNNVQTNGPVYTTDWPTLSYPSVSSPTHILNTLHPGITQVAIARRIGV